MNNRNFEPSLLEFCQHLRQSAREMQKFYKSGCDSDGVNICGVFESIIERAISSCKEHRLQNIKNYGKTGPR